MLRADEGFRVFDRANWRRKARAPTWRRHGEEDSSPSPSEGHPQRED